jgi:hypothetical protein
MHLAAVEMLLWKIKSPGFEIKKRNPKTYDDLEYGVTGDGIVLAASRYHWILVVAVMSRTPYTFVGAIITLVSVLSGRLISTHMYVSFFR